MSHFDFYEYQATARGVTEPEDVMRLAKVHAYLYEQVIGGWLPADRGTPVVDLACGHGSFLCWLRERGYRSLKGVELEPEQVRWAVSAGLQIEEADAVSWLEGQQAGSLGCLFAVDFIEHISKDDFVRLLRASYAALRPGGRFILRYPNGDSPLVGLNLFNDITHVWTYTTTCFGVLARMHGFGSCRFADEGVAAIRDHRWLKVPLGKLSGIVLGRLFQACSRERVHYWSPSIWACLDK